MEDSGSLESKKKYIESWNKTMIDIWTEQIVKLGVIDTGELLKSTVALDVTADGRFYNITLSQKFLEYGLWQDLGTGREKSIGNTGDIGLVTKKGKERKIREKRRWFSTKYYSSVMNLRDFLAEHLGREYLGMFANLDSDDLRTKTDYYRKKGLS